MVIGFVILEILCLNCNCFVAKKSNSANFNQTHLRCNVQRLKSVLNTIYRLI